MSAFASSPLAIPYVSHSMKGLQELMNECSYKVGPLSVVEPQSSKIDEKLEFNLNHVDHTVTVCFSAGVPEKSSTVSVECEKVNQFLKRLSENSSSDFDIFAQALVASFEVQMGDLMTYDKSTYVALTSKALDITEQMRSSNACSSNSKPVSLYVPPFGNDFLHVVTRILKAFAHGKGVVIYCASLRLMVPLFVFTKRAIAAGAPQHIISFLPFKKIDTKDSYVSSIEMIIQPADIGSAVRAIVKGSSYQAGTTSWRPSIVLVEQTYENDFYNKVKSLVSGSTPISETLNENSHLHNTCVVPSYLEEDLDKFLKLAASDGGEIIRPSESTGPIFIFGLTPAAAMLDKAKSLPLGPFTIVIPFRTVKEGLKLAKYFSDREIRVLGAGEYVSFIPKSATIWTQNASLSLQVLAKLSNYTTLGVNSDIHRLAASFYLSECSATCPNVRLPGLPVPVDQVFHSCNASIVADFSKISTSVEKLLQAWRKISFDRRLAVFTPCEDFVSIIPKLRQIKCDAMAQIVPVSPHITLDDQLNCTFAHGRLCLLHKWQVPCGLVNIVLASSELLPTLKELVLSSVVLGNVVLIVAPKSIAPSKEVHAFCGTVNQLVTQCCPALGSLGPIVQVKCVEASSTDISSALSSLAVPGIMCISAPEEECLLEQVSVENLARHVSVFWSVGGDLFAN